MLRQWLPVAILDLSRRVREGKPNIDIVPMSIKATHATPSYQNILFQSSGAICLVEHRSCVWPLWSMYGASFDSLNHNPRLPGLNHTLSHWISDPIRPLK